MDPLGQYLRAKRMASNLTQRKLAARCVDSAPRVPGICASSINFWERGHRGRRPNLEQFEVLADMLGLTVEERLHALRLARERGDLLAATA